MVRIYGIIYGEKRTEYIPYVNHCTTNPHRFEANPIIDIIDNYIADLGNMDWLGILSWKFRQKTGITPVRLHSAAANAPDYVRVINCSPYLGPHIHFMNWSEEGHPGITHFITRCLALADIPYHNDCQPVIYAHQFLARKQVYVDYVSRLLKPSLALLEGELWPQVNRPSGYTAGMELQKLKALTGLDFYNYVPFVIERLFMQYVRHHQLPTIPA